ncbi:MAG: transposase [Firmicutes bacterium]|nr:transposase [Bacillota bacterium]
MMRTRRRLTRQPNKRKALWLRDLIHAYTRQKDAYLVELAKTKNWHLWQAPRKHKRVFAREYSHHTLPIHLEDLCLFDAVATLIAFVESAKARHHWKAQIFHHTTDPEERRRYFTALKHYGTLAKILSGVWYDPWFFHLVRNALMHPPRVHQRRSAMLDSSSYRVFIEQGKQYISLTSLVKGQRIVLPLLGNTPITGTIRLVSVDSDHFEIHTMAKVPIKPFVPQITALALDAGTTEVYTDQHNRRYGTHFGALIAKADAVVQDKGKKRNHIRDAAKNRRFATEKERHAHLRKVRKNNLGQKKQNAQRTKARASFATEINHALNEVLAQQPPRVIVEDLTHMRGKAKGKKMSRTVSMWMRSTLNERADFKTEARGSRLEAVASAYTSQECSQCGFTSSDNRTGDHFRCLWCGTVDTADGNAAKVILKRLTDPDIKPWMHHRQIQQILDHRNLHIMGAIPGAGCEADELVQSSATVNGQTLVTAD